MHRTFYILFSFVLNSLVRAQQDFCSALVPCTIGCCSSEGHCGFGPDFCGSGCQGNCNAVAECGKYANSDSASCPLNVCCSKWGFCGQTAEFCGDGCQSGCLPIVRPSCTATDDSSTLSRKIAYYEIWAADRKCDKFPPESIQAGALTHINIAFAVIDSGFRITDTNGDIVARVSSLKRSNPGLRVNIAIGGWTFNDPPTQRIFSTMASTSPNRQTFINSLVKFLQKYGLDGVDLDWEYPVANDRGGNEEDYSNYVQLLADIRQRFTRTDSGWQLTLTLPSSYWYLRGFDLNGMQKYVDWFNVMTYDIHGLWDQKNLWTGPYLLGHTNLTEIELGLDLLWKNGVNPNKVVMGFGFYGRSFTMADPSCSVPGCTFSSAGIAGDCTGEPGILSYSEVVSRNGSLNSQTTYDPVTTVKYTVYSETQWISYDDAQSFTDKKRFLTERCISGLMIWAIDQDTHDYQALSGLLGDEAITGTLLQGNDLTTAQLSELASEFAAYTGENCYVSPKCTDGRSSDTLLEQHCAVGFTAVETAHAPYQNPTLYKASPEICPEGSYHYICCPTKALPKNCAWNGAPERSQFGCSGTCGHDQFQLNTDIYTDARGQGSCFTGYRKLCCDATAVLQDCSWTGCLNPSTSNCGTGTQYTVRYDNGDGVLCPDSQLQFFCCPDADTYKNCAWTTEEDISLDAVCRPGPCSEGKMQITTAHDPGTGGPLGLGGTFTPSCRGYSAVPGLDPNFKFCCNPPSLYNNQWPVNPTYLWSHAYTDKGSDVLWHTADNYGSNNADIGPDDPTTNPGDDPYGFVMLDGPPDSLDSTFPSNFDVVTTNPIAAVTKRTIVTTNHSIIDSTFDHVEEFMHVYCKFPADSLQCRRVFLNSPIDTIIRLPNHVGEGPFARIVSMEPVSNYELPLHHLQKREAAGNQNGIYKVVFDYAFHEIKRDASVSGPVNLRVDYTNLLPYWKEMTNSPAGKRAVFEGSQTYADWRKRIDNAKVEQKQVQKRVQLKEDKTAQSRALGRRWYGIFSDWLQKLTKVEKEDQGSISMAVTRSIVLYSGRKSCTYGNAQLNAALDVVTDASVAMDARYAYYFSGTVLPLSITNTYAYFGVQPSVSLGIRVNGNAELDWQSDRVKIIDTLSYPGLSIKGLAAVGPTLDLWGQIRGTIKLSGQMQASTIYKFQPAEIYYGDKEEVNQHFGDLSAQNEDRQGMKPSFSAGVQVNAQLDVMITPEAKLGLKVGGLTKLGGTLMDAQIVAFVNSTLRFAAQFVAVNNNGENSASVSYGIYLLYNVGYSCYAQFPFGKGWRTGLNYLFPSGPMEISIYPQHTIDLVRKRSPSLDGILNHFNHRSVPKPARISPPDDSRDYSLEYIPYDPTSNESTALDLTGFGHGVFKRDSGNTDSPGLKCTNEPNNVCAAAQNPGGSKAKRVFPGGASPTNCWRTLPVLTYNCVGFFYNQGIKVPTSKRIQLMKGICNNVQEFHTANNIPNGGLTLTFKIGRTPQAADSCPPKFCERDNSDWTLDYGASRSATSCDEFPFASSEEGGNALFGLNRKGDPRGTRSSCVPVWQQILQGNCNGILRKLSQNINAFNDPPIAANWVPWGSSESTQWFSRNVNSVVQYPAKMARSDGITTAEFNSFQSWRHKRNYTVWLANPVPPTANSAFTGGDFQSASWNIAPAGNPAILDGTFIACAVNIRGQERFRYGNYNGYCYTGGSNIDPFGNETPGFKSCKINFVGSIGPAKRDVIGSFNGWDIESIEMIEDPENFVPTPELSFSNVKPIPAWRKRRTGEEDTLFT